MYLTLRVNNSDFTGRCKATIAVFIIQALLRKYFSFFSNFLEDMSPFCGATDTPVLDFL